MNLSSYVDLVHYGENMNSDGIPQYIFSDPVSQHGVEVSAADLFPQNPKFVEDGIPDEIVTNKMSGQVSISIDFIQSILFPLIFFFSLSHSPHTYP